MNSTKLASIGLAAGLAAVLPAAPVQAAGAARTFLSAAGSDTNNCTNVATPCRHMAAAFAATATNGEIYVLDPANYGSLTITHGVSIQGHGWGSIAPVSGGNGIFINAPSTDVVNLDGLTIDGTGLTGTGIAFATGKSLTVANCVVRNLTHGLIAGNNGTVSLALTVSNSSFNDNVANGILLQPNGSGDITASIDRTVLSGNGFAGLNLIGQNGTSRVRATVTNSVAANNRNGNDGTGFLVQSVPNQATATLTVTSSSAIGNTFGISAFGSQLAALLVGQSTVQNNTNGFSAASSGAIFTYGDNNISLNDNNVGSIIFLAKE